MRLCSGKSEMEAYIQQLEGGKAKLEKEVRVSDVGVILKYLY